MDLERLSSLKMYLFFTGNLCLRKDPEEGQGHLCAYDWEFVSFHVPQRDLGYFLLSTLPISDSHASHVIMWEEYIEIYRQELQKALKNAGNDKNPLVNKFLEKDAFQKATDYAFMECMEDMVAFTGSIPVHSAMACWEQFAGTILQYCEGIRHRYTFLKD